MDKFDRIFQLHTVLASRRTPIDPEILQARLECSRSTLYRLIALMRDTLNAPIALEPEGVVYRQEASSPRYELPGLWFSAAELQSLAVMQRLLRDVGGGLLEDHMAVLGSRLEQLMKHRRLNLGEAATRIRFPVIAGRAAGPAFQIAASATLQRRKLWFQYTARGSNELSERTVSPQRLTHYREVWYLDAWDEMRNALRTFSIDRFHRPVVLEERAIDVPEQELDDHLASAYGIFGGKADKMAVLRFSATRARWVADETWHPQQQGEWLASGEYELRIPYRDERELIMDILRHGADVEVVEPDSLRSEMQRRLQAALDRYR